MERCLCVFLKYPEPGKVKTRLAKDMGERAAARVYRRMVEEVFRQVKRSGADELAIFYSPAEQEQEIKMWLDPLVRDFPGGVSFHPQSQGDLGERLTDAGEILFAKQGDRAVLVVGTDCIEMGRDIFLDAWSHLEQNPGDVVIGPSRDGGYYLIGSRTPIPGLFEDIPWSSETTFAATIEKAKGLQHNRHLLPKKVDIDSVLEYEHCKERLAPQPCVFFDRDGVVNHSPGEGYVLKKEDFHFHEHITDCLEAVREAGYLAILITSQKGVGKELMSEGDLEEIHREMQRKLACEGAAFDGIYAYTGQVGTQHRPKPEPEMILTACKDFSIDPGKSWMIGDADRDIEMGQNAGLKGTIRVEGEKPITVQADYTVENILELSGILKKLL